MLCHGSSQVDRRVDIYPVPAVRQPGNDTLNSNKSRRSPRMRGKPIPYHSGCLTDTIAPADNIRIQAQCWALATPPSCGSLDNSTCICSTPHFNADIVSCLDDNCPLVSVYAALRLSNGMCNRLRRSRKAEIWEILPLHVFAMICVITRLYAKAFILRRFGMDDWIISVAALLYFGWFCVGHHRE